MKRRYLKFAWFGLAFSAGLALLVQNLPLKAGETRTEALAEQAHSQGNYTIEAMIDQFSRDDDGQLKPAGFTQAEVAHYFDSAMAVVEDFSDQTRILAVKGGGFIDRGDLADDLDTLVNVGSESQPDYCDLRGPDVATVGQVKATLYAAASDAD